jgi:hypothetical protein
LKLNRCEFTDGFTMTGTGFYSTELDRFSLSVKTTGRWTCDLKYVRSGERIMLSGKCNGKPIHTDFDDQNLKHHQFPDLMAPQKAN